MRNVYYKYNEKTKMYDRVYPNMRSRLLTYLRNIFFWALLGVGGYFMALLILGTPEDAEDLREENARLQTQYEVLSQRLDEAMEVMEDIRQRDDNLYRVMFMADPVSEDVRNATYTGTNRYEELEDLDNAALVMATTQKTDMLARKLYIQSKSFDEIVDFYKNHEDMLRHLPAIQPVSNKDLKRTASGFGYRIHPIYQTRIFHDGMDFSCDIGTPVYATADGVVKNARWERGYGYIVTIDHGYGYETRYAHLKSFNVKRGQKVVRGETIALSGNTGRSSGPHVHYEVLQRGRPVNPANYYFMDLDADQYDEMIRMANNHGKVMD
ncbi:MAG: peptidoglycan DD-metalloendopeptidase family protein [Bacteroidaceae bacterium]|nr:peptidoglycan DD-metalloendopeptidase family protein [Bacteroidaceae bacterium]MBR6602223.1 peptidoglycan DD-metalloendopeptidase family protein [Bacteroidaceae bacterium]